MVNPNMWDFELCGQIRNYAYEIIAFNWKWVWEIRIVERESEDENLIWKWRIYVCARMCVCVYAQLCAKMKLKTNRELKCSDMLMVTQDWELIQGGRA